MVALTIIHYLIANRLKVSICMHYNIFYVCMILTKWIAEIQRFFSEQGAFLFVIVQVQQQGSLETCIHVIPMPK